MAEITTTAAPTANEPAASGTGDPVWEAIASSAEALSDDASDETADGGEATTGTSADADPATPAIAEAQTTPEASAPKPKGRIPLARHEAILKKARDDAAADHAKALKAHEDRLKALAWAETPEGRAEFWLRTLENAEQPDAIARALAEHPKYAGLIALKSAQAASEAPTPAKGEHPFGPMPNPYVQQADGTVALSADGMQAYTAWVSDVSAWKAQQEATAAFEARLGPIEQKEIVADKTREVYGKVASALAQARTHLPRFAELEATIKPLALQHRDVSTGEALLRGYTQVLVEKVIPDLEAKATVTRDQIRQELIAEMQQKAGAAGDRVESAPAGGTPSSGSDDPVTAAIRQTARKLSRTAA